MKNKKMKNAGLHTYRFKDNPEEKKFAEAWEQENNRTIGRDLIEYLLGGDGTNVIFEITDQDRLVAATVIQWLGSPVGQCFLRDLGYEKKEK